jgi:hypothetical protein
MCRPESEQSPGAFARDLFTPTSVASRYISDTSQDNIVLADYERCPVEYGYGGWPEYHFADVEDEQELKTTNHGGRRINSMTRQNIAVNDHIVGAFVTEYGGSTTPRMRQAHSQMAVWAFCDALGLDVPRHHWYPDEEIVVVEEVGHPEEGVSDLMSLDYSVAERIRREDLLNYISTQLLAGVEDLLPKNFKVSEAGEVYVFDFDKADHQFVSDTALSNACVKAEKTIGVLNRVRDEPLSINREMICSRTQEIATQIHRSSHYDRVLGTVELYDDVFSDETEEEFKSLFENNITVLSTVGQ